MLWRFALLAALAVSAGPSLASDMFPDKLIAEIARSCRGKPVCSVGTSREKITVRSFPNSNARELYVAEHGPSCGSAGCYGAVLEYKDGKLLALEEILGLTNDRVQKIVESTIATRPSIRTSADAEFVGAVLTHLRGMRIPSPPIVCAENYEYVEGHSQGKSMEGNVALLLIDVTVINRKNFVIDPHSFIGDACGKADRPVQPGQRFVLSLKAQFRKFDTGWKLETVGQ